LESHSSLLSSQSRAKPNRHSKHHFAKASTWKQGPRLLQRYVQATAAWHILYITLTVHVLAYLLADIQQSKQEVRSSMARSSKKWKSLACAGHSTGGKWCDPLYMQVADSKTYSTKHTVQVAVGL
jgi:hypothetical protein